jgi:hypothetical protein
VHAGKLHPIDGADGAGELTFERAQVVDVLDEAGGAERVGFVEDLVADAAAFRQPGLRKLHAQPRDPVLRHHHDCAVIAHLERNALALEVLDDGGRVFIGEVGEQRRQLRRRDAHDEEAEETDHRRRDGDHGGQPCCPQTSQESQQTLQATSP